MPDGDRVRTPTLLPGVRLHHDRARDRWVLLAPERMLLLEGSAVAVLHLVDGARSLEDIVHILAQRFDADPATIRADVMTLLDDLVARHLLALAG